MNEMYVPSRCPASGSPTNPPVTYFMNTGKNFLNQGLFSLNKGDSAIQPG